jgi:hypothetical protein
MPGMMQLWDDTSLSFNKIKKILTAASNGELVGTEKTDGFKIYLGYSDGVPKAARSKGDMSKGGMNWQALADREFKGGDEVRKAYLDSFRAYSKALNSLEERDLAAIFGENHDIFYSSEIQGPAAGTMINYDANVLSLHSTGHKRYNAETKKMEDVENPQGAIVLDNAIDKFEEILQDEPFAVRRTALLKLNQLSDGHDLSIALSRMNKAGFSGTMTIDEFLEGKLKEYLDGEASYLHGDIRQRVIDRILKRKDENGKTIGIPSITKGMPPEVKKKISALVKHAEELKKDFIFPIEDAIHDFSVELLRAVESSYILDNTAETERLKQEVEVAIRELQKYEGEGADIAHDVLGKQLKKLKRHDNVSTAVEGFVFQVGDRVYKFTGNFTPMHHLLALFSFGKKGLPPIKKQQMNEAETFFNAPSNSEMPPEINEPSNPEDKKFLVLIPGGFKPPHKGHYNLVKSYLNHPSVEKVAIIIGDMSRSDSEGEIEIGYDESIRTWKEYGITEGNDVTFVRAKPRQLKISKKNPEGGEYENPMSDVYDLVQDIDPSELQQGNMAVAMGSSDKDNDYRRTQIFAKGHQPGGKYHRQGVTVTEPPVKVSAGDYSYPEGSKYAGQPISATHMRDAVAQNDIKEFSYHLPEEVLRRKSEKDIQNLMDDLGSRGNYEEHERPNYDEDTNAPSVRNPAALDKIGEGLDIYSLLERVVEQGVDVEEAIEEMSIGAAAEGGAGSSKRKKKPTIFREEEEELEEDRQGWNPNYPSGRDADDRTNEEDPETGKSGNVGPKYKIAREQVDVEEVTNYLLEMGVFTG